MHLYDDLIFYCLVQENCQREAYHELGEVVCQDNEQQRTWQTMEVPDRDNQTES